MRAWDEGLDFRSLVRADAEIARVVDLEQVFSIDSFTRHSDVVFARLRDLVSEREAVNA
jgi:hypothetical protein